MTDDPEITPAMVEAVVDVLSLNFVVETDVRRVATEALRAALRQMRIPPGPEDCAAQG